jgi:hypothetical protein
MNCAAFWEQGTSSTTTLKNTKQVWFAKSSPWINRVIDAVSDVDLYESAEERKPGTTTIIAAAALLADLSALDARSVEIEPYSGELSLIWRIGHSRVKATFGMNAESFSAYHERIAGGHVIENHLEPNASKTYLNDRLAWLHNNALNV